MSKNKINVIIIVINPSSGAGKEVDYEPIIKRYSDLYGYKYMIYYTSGTGDSRKLKNHIDEFKPEMVMAVGGDGTINLVASLIIDTQIILGIIPGGSANGLAFNLNIPTNFEYALKINLEAQFKSIDAILINNEHYCFHLSDLGLNARVVKRFEKEGSKGLLGYGKQLFKELLTKKTYFSYSLKTDNEFKKSKAEMLVITNAHSFGTGVKINPAGELSDGLFEIVVIKPYPWWFVLTFIIAGFSGHLDKMQSVNIFKTRNAEIKLEESQEFQIDGEIIGKTDSVKIELLRNSLKVVYNV
ncbi:MAG: diacylglycerol kinase [Marinilabiliales bacterium]|nr:MAG: diacylglycerol kinase [Marinilabiliales bacterium]